MAAMSGLRTATIATIIMSSYAYSISGYDASFVVVQQPQKTWKQIRRECKFHMWSFGKFVIISKPLIKRVISQSFKAWKPWCFNQQSCLQAKRQKRKDYIQS